MNRHSRSSTVSVFTPFGKRIQLSLVVAQTHRLLFQFLLATAVALGVGYLFWVNHMGFQGVILSEVMQEQLVHQDELAQLEARIASYSASSHVAETDKVTGMAPRTGNKYLVIRRTFTAQAEDENGIQP